MIRCSSPSVVVVFDPRNIVSANKRDFQHKLPYVHKTGMKQIIAISLRDPLTHLQMLMGPCQAQPS